MFLSANDVIFSQPSDDEWYAAHMATRRDIHFSLKLPGNQSFYVRDDPVRVLGCTSQYQFCNPNSGPGKDCTPLDGGSHGLPAAQRLWPSERQKAAFNWTATAILSTVMTLGTSALTSRNSLFDGLQGPLPSNQWEKDAQHWFQSILADLQRAVTEVATGPLNRSIDRLLVRPESAEEHLVCRSQVRTSAPFPSFPTSPH